MNSGAVDLVNKIEARPGGAGAGRPQLLLMVVLTLAACAVLPLHYV